MSVQRLISFTAGSSTSRLKTAQLLRCFGMDGRLAPLLGSKRLSAICNCKSWLVLNYPLSKVHQNDCKKVRFARHPSGCIYQKDILGNMIRSELCRDVLYSFCYRLLDWYGKEVSSWKDSYLLFSLLWQA